MMLVRGWWGLVRGVRVWWERGLLRKVRDDGKGRTENSHHLKLRLNAAAINVTITSWNSKNGDPAVSRETCRYVSSAQKPMRMIEVSMKQRRNERAGGRDIPEKTRRPAASSGTIPTCENLEWPGRELNPVIQHHKVNVDVTCIQYGRWVTTTIMGVAYPDGGIGKGEGSKVKVEDPDRSACPDPWSPGSLFRLTCLTQDSQCQGDRGRSSVVVRLFPLPLQDKLDSTSGREAPGFSHVGIVPADEARWGFYLGSPVSPALAFQCCSIFTSNNPQDLDIKTHQNLSTPPPRLNFTVLYAQEPESFPRGLLHRYEDTPSLTELRSSNARLNHRGSKLDLRSDLRSTQETVAPFQFRAGLVIEMKFISNRQNWWFEISIPDQQPSSTNSVWKYANR
ncbi:hypothetical protein PR048_012095 [Dryococelus australis]|uniref:Uncharacterized protein n=1 Tax=Dryococelus australis TaxID=614101 RepID=A0ABQ9HNG3_9NEOP|nr:hypothetical protein PR048_012095 [Dryococelus australis]